MLIILCAAKVLVCYKEGSQRGGGGLCALCVCAWCQLILPGVVWCKEHLTPITALPGGGHHIHGELVT